MINFLICLILSLWISAIAIFSIQNVAPVSLQFLFFRSIELPIGVVLALSMSAGLLGIAVAQPLWKLANWQSDNSPDDEIYE